MELLSMQFFTALGTIILLDILLGGDNAVVIAMAANKLSPALRKRPSSSVRPGPSSFG